MAKTQAKSELLKKEVDAVEKTLNGIFFFFVLELSVR